VTVTSGGVYKCNLVGTYVGLVHQNSGLPSICELRAYPWESIETTGATAQSSVNPYVGIAYESSWVTEPRDLWVWNYLKLHQTYTNSDVNPSWSISFDTSKYINMVVYIGGMEYQDNCSIVEPWVGDFPEPTDNQKIGGPFNCQFEAPVNSNGKHVFIRRNDENYLNAS